MQYKKPDPFYLSKAWREIREVALCRDNYLCQRCLQRGHLTPADLVHHVLPRDTHPKLELVLDNLQSVCMGCHAQLHGMEQERPVPQRRARVIKG